MKKIALHLTFACLSFLWFGSGLAAQTSFTVRNAKAGGNFLWSIASGPTGLVAVGDGGTILASANGTVWSRRDSGVTDWLVGVTYGAGLYVVVGEHGLILTSTDATSWSVVPQNATTARLNNVIYSGGKFVAVGEGGAIITSPDARVWTARSSGVTGWLRGIVYLSPGLSYTNLQTNQKVLQNFGFWACGQDGVLLRSLDGETWKSIGYYNNLHRDIEAMVATGPVGKTTSFRAIGAEGVFVTEANYEVYYSKTPGPNGLPVASSNYWIIANSSLKTTARLRGLAIAADALFATGEGGLILSAPSSYWENTWKQVPSGTTANLVSGLQIGNSLFIVGENETILQSTPLYFSRLTNISTRGQVGAGANALIAGFVVNGSARKTMLIRAAGPALAKFGVSGALAAPVLTLLDSAGRAIATNAGWSTNPNATMIADTASQVGAFPFVANSGDSALLATLDPGAYTLKIEGVGGATGVALIEAYDADGLASDGARAINISTRGLVGTGGAVLIAGFNIGGAAARRVLIRAVGPSLGRFGVTGALAEPQIELYAPSLRSAGPWMTAEGSWSAASNADELRGAAMLSGAFALTEDSKDTALIATLPPGSYTVVIRGKADTSGIALVEIYDLP